MLSKTGNYRLYYSLYPFEKKDMICERSFMIVPIGIKKGKLIYKEKNQVNHFYVPNCKASGFLNNVRSIDYNTLLHDTYKNLSLIYCSFRYLRIKRAVSLPYLQIVFYSINCLSSDVIIFCSF